MAVVRQQVCGIERDGAAIGAHGGDDGRIHAHAEAVGIGVEQSGDPGLQIAEIHMPGTGQRVGDQIGGGAGEGDELAIR